MLVTVTETAQRWCDNFNRFAGDLYPDYYTMGRCVDLAEQSVEIMGRKEEKSSTLLVHYYQRPEFHEIADFTGDSLALSLRTRKAKYPRVDFAGVYFMASTGKILAPESRFFTQGGPEKLGCSLVNGTDMAWIRAWKEANPSGVLVTYINSSDDLKAISDYVTTSRNTMQATVDAVTKNPGQKILLLPDKFLGGVMRLKALRELREQGVQVDPRLIEVYKQEFNGNNACCYVHEPFGNDAIYVAMAEHPDAVLLIHPECGCAADCQLMVEEGQIAHDKAYTASTEKMIEIAMASSQKKFLVATETGLLYALRKRMPEKTFLPVSVGAQCKFMKGNTFEGLLGSLTNDRLEILICDNCSWCEGDARYRNSRVIHIPRRVADAALVPIERGLAIP